MRRRKIGGEPSGRPAVDPLPMRTAATVRVQGGRVVAESAADCVVGGGVDVRGEPTAPSRRDRSGGRTAGDGRKGVLRIHMAPCPTNESTRGFIMNIAKTIFRRVTGWSQAVDRRRTHDGGSHSREAQRSKTVVVAIRRAVAVVCVLGLVSWASPVRAQAPKAKVAPLKGEERMLAAPDGWPIHITYFPSERGKEAPVVILLHMKGRNHRSWTHANSRFVRRLIEEGYAVVAVDLRKHGKSVPSGTAAASKKGAGGGKSAKSAVDRTLRAADFQMMVLGDLEAVKAFILQEHQNGKLNVRKLAIIAAEMSAPLAINFTVNDWAKPPYNDAPAPRPGMPDARTPRGQDVQALVLLSPENSVPGVSTSRTIPVLKALPVAVFIGVAKGDKRDRGTAKRLYSQLGGGNPNRKGLYFAEYPGNARGTDLLLIPQLKTDAHVLGFLKKHVASLDIPWRDRRSRLLE
ncbi:MAG: hypothetical protein D6725_17915 [Planctomycetota bacterium]|nr:MAG: hypothetical protein D6725_17915 [Planctomycetota bacterium]